MNRPNRQTLRLAIRRQRANDARPDSSPKTTTPYGARKARNRRANRIAAASRKANR